MTTFRWKLDSPDGHIVCTLVVFAIGCALYAFHYDYGKEVMAGALGSLWTLLQLPRSGSYNFRPEVVNQAETITVAPEKQKAAD
ncbi:MAG TPA: hypothetical protein VKX25_19335 [Bryobacteraceae bacterium]|jgi:hypothetical protein|nr:hypothetical protein [Bryobacteraceae bacterium]